MEMHRGESFQPRNIEEKNAWNSGDPGRQKNLKHEANIPSVEDLAAEGNLGHATDQEIDAAIEEGLTPGKAILKDAVQKVENDFMIPDVIRPKVAKQLQEKMEKRLEAGLTKEQLEQEIEEEKRKLIELNKN